MLQIKMSTKKGHVINEHLCRLCLKVTGNKFETDEIVRQIFDILLIKLDLGISRGPIICEDCLELAKKCLNFKYTCINTEKIILSYATDAKKIKHKIKVIYEERKPVVTVFYDDFSVCRFCMTRIERNNFVSLDALMNESTFEMLPQYMTEMDFKIIENPLICGNCRENLVDCFKFVLKCTDGKNDLRGIRDVPNLDMCQDILCTSDIRQLVASNDHVSSSTSDLQSYIPVDIDVSTMFHKCSLCSFKSKYKHNLKTHMLVHKDVSEIEMFKCSLCAYEARQHLKSHMLFHKDVSEIQTFKCSLCSFESKYKRCLKPHLLVHKDVSEIQTFKCSLCPFEVKHKRNLKDHMLVHKEFSQIQRFKCSLCSFDSKHKRSLKTHMLIHKDVSEIKMFKCSLCSFETKYKGNLKSHILVHKDV